MSAEDERQERYLWDPAAPVDPEVRALEDRLASARFGGRSRSLSLPTPSLRNPTRLRMAMVLAAAAVLLIAVSLTTYWSWRWSWTAGTAWAAEIDDTTDHRAVKTSLAVDQPLHLARTTSARVDIARIGTMNVSPESTVTLAETTSGRHRVRLDRGSVSVRIWAPPGMFAFRTPAGTIRDLGCIFDLTVDGEGTARVRVDTGWVQMDNNYGESLVPAGAVADMRPVARPGVPIYRDASDVFAAAVRAAQDGGDTAVRGELDTIVHTARRRDVLTLLMLANVTTTDVKRVLLARAAELWPPPSDVSIDAIVSGDRDQLWKWDASLDLPPAKSWWRNWKDALPRP
jgi:hypothetical protein